MPPEARHSFELKPHPLRKPQSPLAFNGRSVNITPSVKSPFAGTFWQQPN
jgi:hypothetical protein